MYTYPEGERASVLDERGQPLGGSLRLETVEID
jgi:hypothetical protein